MSTFSTVLYTASCPSCEALITQWQTHDVGDGSGELRPWQVSQFDGVCRCGAYIRATVDAETQVVVKRCDVTLKQLG